MENLVLEHVQVNKAPLGRRRSFRAHGRIIPYLSHPCHIELIATEVEKHVPKPSIVTGKIIKLGKKQLSKLKLRSGAALVPKNV